MNPSTKSPLRGFSHGAVFGVVLACSLLAVFSFLLLTRSETTSPAPREDTDSFINPVAHLVKNKNLSIGERISLQEELKTLAEKARSLGVLSNYGIYYRELISGPVIALNQQEGFFPASLLKLPVALWYFKQAETDPGLLSAKINFTGPPGVSIEHFPPKTSLTPGTIYTIEELIEYMLIESDNDATHILTEYAGGREEINTVYTDLGMKNVEDYSTYTMDVHTYTALFRVLYNAEYLNEEASGRLLTVLSRSTFENGLTALLPAEVIVAHKFGERTIDPERNIRQLHDCGVVYARENPYLLCIMTQGSNYDDMAAFIAEASRRIYTVASASL